LCSEPVEIRWLDFNGHEIAYGSLQPKSRYNVSTFMTHPWVFFQPAQEKFMSVMLGGVRVPTFEYNAALNILGHPRNPRSHIPEVLSELSRGIRPFPVHIVPTFFPIHSLRKLSISKIVNQLRSYEGISQLEVPDILKPEVATLYRARNPLF